MIFFVAFVLKILGLKSIKIFIPPVNLSKTKKYYIIALFSFFSVVNRQNGFDQTSWIKLNQSELVKHIT